MLLLTPIIPFQLWGEGTTVLKFDHHRIFSLSVSAVCGTREAVMDRYFIGQITQLGHADNNNSSA